MSSTNDIPEASSNSSPSPSNAGRPWTADEEAEMRRLRNEGKQYKEIAKRLGRSTQGIKKKMKWSRTQASKRTSTSSASPRAATPTSPKAKPSASPAAPSLIAPNQSEPVYVTIDWAYHMDGTLIKGYREGVPIETIAKALQLPLFRVKERWDYLLAEDLIPDDVSALVVRNSSIPQVKLPPAQAEDEAILALWIAMKDDVDIVKIMQKRYAKSLKRHIVARRELLGNGTHSGENGPEESARQERKLGSGDGEPGKEIRIDRAALKKWAGTVNVVDGVLMGEEKARTIGAGPVVPLMAVFEKDKAVVVEQEVHTEPEEDEHANKVED